MALPEERFQEFIDEQLQPEEKQDGWQIKTDDEANWALRKIKQAKDALVKKEEFAKREIERIQTWLDAEKESAGKDVSFFETALYGYFRALQAEGALGNKKSLKLPHGTLQMRKKQAKLERDDNKLIEVARPLGLVKVKESLDWSEFKKRLVVDGFKVIDKETGEVLEGITVIEPEHDEFSVKVD